MPHQKWPPSLSRFIQCGSLPRGRRRKTLAAHVTTERKRAVTWAPPLYGNNLSTASAKCVFRLGSTGTNALSSEICEYPCAKTALNVAEVSFFDRVLTIKAPGVL